MGSLTKNKVLTLLSGGFGGGVKSIVKDLAEEVTSHCGRQFAILTVQDTGTQLNDGEDADFFYDGDEQISCTVRNIWRQVDQAQIFVINGIGIDFALANYARSKGVRIVYIIHGDSDYYYSTAKRFLPIIDMFVAISSTIARCLKAKLGEGTPLVTIHNSVSLPETVQEDRPSDVIRLVYVGSIDDKLKGLDRAPAVIRELLLEKIPFHLTVIGDGPYLPTLKSELSASGAENQVSFLGMLPRNQAMVILAEQDILLLFSHSEGMNIAMLEAMARGVVPVIPVTSGATDVIKDGVNGFLVRQDSLTDMVDRISLLRNRPGLWSQMSITARQTIKSGFSLNRAAFEYEKLFVCLDDMGPWQGTVPQLVHRRDIFDLPIFPNLVAKMFRKARNA